MSPLGNFKIWEILGRSGIFLNEIWNELVLIFLKCEIHVAYQSVCKLYRLSDAYYVVTLNEREREL